jgi:diguanylate cyclase (GGDEF)-like protein/PAS domain S-box-containing protein
MITDMISAIAYIAIACLVNNVFMATEGTVLGGRGWVVISVALTGALLQVSESFAVLSGQGSLVPAFQVCSAICLLTLPATFWPAASRLRRGQARIVNRRLLTRVERAEAATVAAQKWLALAEQSGHVGHWQLTVPGHKLIWSDEVFRIHGLWREHYKPRMESAIAAFHPVDAERVMSALDMAENQKQRFEVSVRLRRPDGEIRHVILRGMPQLDEAGRVDAVAGVMVDVTEPKRAANKLLPHAALRDIPLEDSLTGLADRRQFDLSLGYEFKRAVRSRKPLGLVLIEIDYFYEFNEHYGELEGDACLRQVAQAIQAVPRRTGDVVARYAGAEIAVLLPLADAAGAATVARSIAEAVRVLGLPNAGAPTGHLTISCGAAAFVGMDDLYNPLELSRRASRALADAKAAGGNRVSGFNATEFLEALAQRV